MNRPLTPYKITDLYEIRKNSDSYTVWLQNYDCMQEALTVEWLIEYGLIPEPKNFELMKSYSNKPTGWYMDWECKDCDPDGKPEDYKVKQ